MSAIEKKDLLYEGKAKQIFRTLDPQLLWVYYKDDATALNGLKKGTITNKGELNNKISSLIFQHLTAQNIPHHFVKELSPREQLVKRVTILPVEVVIRNLAAGSICKRLGFEEGQAFSAPLVEFYYKNDALADPLVTEEHIALLGLATKEQIATIKDIALQINSVLREFMQTMELTLVDFKLEFGELSDGTVILADEISPDTCRLWDSLTQEKLDKDRFRQDLGGVEDAYQEIYKRIQAKTNRAKEGSDSVSFDDFLANELNEECGVFGMYGHTQAADLCYYGLHALQHRGQESAGIVVSDGTKFRYHKGMGLVTDVFPSEQLAKLVGKHAVGHVRYTTAGESKVTDAQPFVFKYRAGTFALAHNGNLVNAAQIRRYLERQGSIFQTNSDTEVIAHLIARSPYDQIELAFQEALSMIKGAYALLIMTEDKLIAALDPNGLRPLSLARLDDGYCFASETCAFDIVGAEYEREVHPGEMIIIDKDGLQSGGFNPQGKRSMCSFEYIYFARPDSNVVAINVHQSRKDLGRQLAKEHPADADVVIGVPDSSISAAMGYAEALGIPNELGLIKNRYVGRTFIQPTQELRAQGVRMKLSVVRKVVEGKRVVMIDDSIVRGTTSSRIVKLLLEAGAKEVHVRISSPPVANPCYYGIDTSTKDQLIVASKSMEEIRQFIGADTLEFLSVSGLATAIGCDQGLCLACFNGAYPTEIYPEDVECFKHE